MNVHNIDRQTLWTFITDRQTLERSDKHYERS